MLLAVILCLFACMDSPPEDATNPPISAETEETDALPPVVSQEEHVPLEESYPLAFTKVDFAYEPLPLAELPQAGSYRQEEVLPGVVQSFSWVEETQTKGALYLTINDATYLLDDESIQPGDFSLLTASPFPSSEQVYVSQVGKGANYATNLYIIIREGVPLVLCRLDGPDIRFVNLKWNTIPAAISTQSTQPFTTIYLFTPDIGYEYAVVNNQTDMAWVSNEGDFYYLGTENPEDNGPVGVYCFDAEARILVKEAERAELSEQLRPQGPLYFILNNQFMGSWEKEHWRSINDTGGDYNDSEAFLLADFLAQPGFALYSRHGYIGYTQRVRLCIGEGLGGWLDGSKAHLLGSYALKVDSDYGTFALPATLTGGAAQVEIPDYGYSPELASGSVDLATNSTDIIDPAECIQWGGQAPNEVIVTAESLLRQNDNSGTPNLTEMAVYTYPETGRETCFYFFNSPRDDYGYPDTDMADGGIYSMVLCQNADKLEIIYEEYLPYTDDVTSLFLVAPCGIFDLNGDGQPEVCVVNRGWEGGYTCVFSRGEGDMWKPVLRGNWGT